MIYFFTLLTTFLLGSLNSQANGNWWDKGNGGFVLSCGTNLRTFDLHELESRHKGRLSLDHNKSSSLEERVTYLISKFDRLNPSRAHLYRQWFKSFFSETRFTQDAIYPLPDIGFGEIPKGCSLLISVYQRNPSILTPERYTIHEPLWKKLSIQDKAALILHELIYREATQEENQHLTSERSRYLNAWLNSQEFASVSLKNYLLHLRELNFQAADFGPYKVILGHYDSQSREWVPTPLAFHLGSEQPSQITVLSQNSSAWPLNESPFRKCFEETIQSSPQQLSLSENGDVTSLHMKISKPCLVSIKNRTHLPENLDSLSGFEGRIQGDTFSFTETRTSVFGTYEVGYVFYFDNFRFEISSNAFSLEHKLEKSVVQEINIGGARACKVVGTRRIRIFEGNEASVRLNLRSGQLDSFANDIGECSSVY